MGRRERGKGKRYVGRKEKGKGKWKVEIWERKGGMGKRRGKEEEGEKENK